MSFPSNSSGHQPTRPTLNRGARSPITVKTWPGTPSYLGVEGQINGPNVSNLHRSGARRIPSSAEVERAPAITLQPIGTASAKNSPEAHSIARKPVAQNAGAKSATTTPTIKRKAVPASAHSSAESLARSYQSSVRCDSAGSGSPSPAMKRKPVGTNGSVSEVALGSNSGAKDSSVSIGSHSKPTSEMSASEIPGIYGGVPDGGYSKRYPGRRSRFMEMFAELVGLPE